MSSSFQSGSGGDRSGTSLSGSTAGSWELLANQLDAFIAAWELNEGIPDLAAHLRDVPDSMQRLVLIELIKVDLEFRYRDLQRGVPKRRLQDYVAAFPQLHADTLPADLIFEEYHIRKAAGDAVDPHDYFAQFPRQAADLRRMFAIESPSTTSMLIGRRAAEDLQAGDVIDDFQLLARLGRGAFGSVFLARQQSMQRLVALKISKNRGKEPQTLAQLDHPHIVRVFDQRTLAERHERLMYMQYVGGDTLEGLIQHVQRIPATERTGKLVLELIQSGLDRGGGFVTIDAATRARFTVMDWLQVVCEFGAQIASALDYAHSQGVLHRDVKPANVLIGADGGAKLADFNISYSSHVSGAAAAAYFGGSLAFMSPEQLEASNPEHPRRADELDGRSDLYSLGVVLYELLCGQRPFAMEEFAGSWSETLAAMTQRRRNGLIAPAEVPRHWRRVQKLLLRCLAPDRENRFGSGEELVRELRLCLHPRAAELMDVESSGWRRFVARHAMWCVMLAALIPNALAGIFNFFYNKEWIDKVPFDVFWNIQFVVNGIAFPIGLIIVGYFVRPVAKRLKTVHPHSPPKPAAMDVARRALRLGDYIAYLGIAEWAIAGLVYPIALHLLVGGLGWTDYLHFVTSLVLSGLIAAAYPFFLIGFLGARVFLPALYADHAAGPRHLSELEALVQRAAIYLFIAGGVPALAITLLLTAGLQSDTPRFALVALSSVGALGFGAVLLLYRAMQSDSEAMSIDDFRLMILQIRNLKSEI